jgi:hypothetical protein
MAKVKIQGNASGTGVLTVTAPNTSTDRTITLPDATGELLSTAGGTMTGDLILGDDVSLEIGSGTNGDLQLYHSGGHNTIDSKTGDLVIRTNALRMYNQANSEALIKGDADGEVQLFHNGVEKFNTTATGVAVTGGVAIGGTGTANTLDDYEEGTFSVTLSAVGGQSASNTCRYTKIGNMVTVDLSWDTTQPFWNVQGSENAAVTITSNLPFTPLGTGSFVSGITRSIKVSGKTENDSQISIGWQHNQAAMYLGDGRGNTYWVNDNVVKASTQSYVVIQGSFTYMTS